MKDRWMRAEAEIANVRARARREVDETRQYAVQKFATDVVEAAENLQARPRQPAAAPSRRAGDRRPSCARASRASSAASSASLERNGIKREDPTGAAVRSQPAPGDGRAGERGAPARHRDAGLDPGLDPERPAAAAGHGGGGQGAAGGDSPAAGQAGHHGLMRQRADHAGERTKIDAPALARPASPPYIAVTFTHVGTPAVLRAAPRPLKGAIHHEQSHRYRPRHHELLRRHHGRQGRPGDREQRGRAHHALAWSPSPTAASAWSASPPSARRSPTRPTPSTPSSA